MKLQARALFTVCFLLFGFALLTGCSSSEDDPKIASIIPAVNPDFDSIDLVAKATDAAGPYTDLLPADYSFANSKITLKEGAIGATGNFFKIVGTATVDGTAGLYTVFTYVESNSTSAPAHELTTLAVAKIADGTNTISTWTDAVDAVADETGLTEEDIIAAMTEHQRMDVPNLSQVMQAMASDFAGGSLDITTSFASVKAPNMDQIAWGAQLYDNWMGAPMTMPKAGDSTPDAHAGHDHGKPSARGTDTSVSSMIPDELKIGLASGETLHDGEHHEGFTGYARCKSCHGWDRRGQNGGYIDRGHNSPMTLVGSTNTEDTAEFLNPRPNAGKSDANTNTRDISAGGYTVEQVAKTAGNYANISTPITGATVASAATTWNAAVSETDGSGHLISNKHPDYRTAGSTGNMGFVNSMVPSDAQMEAIVAFLNFDGAKTNKVFKSVSVDTSAKTVSYTLIDDADAQEGEHRYAEYCFRCHGAPNNAAANPLGAAGNNFNAYLADESSKAKLFHFARWGKAGTKMSRHRIGYPTSDDVANIIAYLTAFKAGTFTSSHDNVGTTGAGDKAAGQTFYERTCQSCHSAHNGDTTTSTGEDTTARCHNHDDDSVVSGTIVDLTDSTSTCPTGSATIPNLAYYHFGMTSLLSTLNMNMGHIPALTQENINDLAAYFTAVAAGTVAASDDGHDHVH